MFSQSFLNFTIFLNNFQTTGRRIIVFGPLLNGDKINKAAGLQPTFRTVLYDQSSFSEPNVRNFIVFTITVKRLDVDVLTWHTYVCARDNFVLPLVRQ